jgi:hypothetical protein
MLPSDPVKNFSKTSDFARLISGFLPINIKESPLNEGTVLQASMPARVNLWVKCHEIKLKFWPRTPLP